MLDNILWLLPVEVFRDGKTFQNLKVSSPAPVTIVSPLGLIAKNKTRLLCPVKVTIF